MPSEPLTPARPWRGRTVVLAGILLVALNLRIAVASVSPVLDDVRREVMFTAAEVGLLGTAPVFSFAVFGSLAPVLARRFGLEPTIIGAMVVSAVGEVVRAQTVTASGFLLWSVIALAGMGMGNVLLPPLVKRYFPDRIGTVTAVYSVVLTVSTAMPPMVAVPLAVRLGWRVSIGSWAVIGVLAVVPWVVVVVRSAAARAALREVLRRAPTDTPALASRHRHGGRVWRSPLAWGIALAFGMNSLCSYVIFAWLPQVLADAGVGASEAGGWLALYGGLNLPASLLAPPLAERLRNPFWLVAGFVALFTSGLVGLMVAPGGLLWLWVLLMGLGGGTFPVMLALISLRTRTSAAASSLSGFAQGAGYALAGIGPTAVGVLHEATGGWTGAFVLLLGAQVVLLAGAGLAGRPTMLEDTWGAR